jgi:hypothetical protein
MCARIGIERFRGCVGEEQLVPASIGPCLEIRKTPPAASFPIPHAEHAAPTTMFFVSPRRGVHDHDQDARAHETPSLFTRDRGLR